MSRTGIVIFGAAVWADGRPSPSLARRIGYALAAAREHPDALILCSGAAGVHGPSEASVMSHRLREGGIDPRRLHLDEASTDTLQSVIATAAFVRREGLADCRVCSDRYHLPRIRLLLSLLGVETAAVPTDPGRAGTPARYWLRMRLREAVATPYDAAILLARRRAILRTLDRTAGP